MAHPNGEPVPVPARVLLPAPIDVDSNGIAGWRFSNGMYILAEPGRVEVITPWGDGRSLDAIESDALAALAAVRWARGQQ